MRTNALKAKLARGDRCVGVLTEINSPELLELFGHLGFDFVFIDGQHSGLTVETGRQLIRAADYAGLTSLVRVPRLDASVILEWLDIGAMGIIVPNITTRAEVDAAVSFMTYPPAGVRGGFGRSRAAGYGLTQTQVEYFTKISDEILFIPLIEDEAALPNLAEICGAPGVDVVLIGPGDLALSMGLPGGWTNPRTQQAVAQIRAAAQAAGKPAMTLVLDSADANRLYADGFQILQVSVAGLIIGAAKQFMQEIGQA